MLVLSRRVDERIELGPEITVTVVRIDGEQVRLGIDAPPEIVVLRSELVDAHPPETPPGDTAQLVEDAP